MLGLNSPTALASLCEFSVEIYPCDIVPFLNDLLVNFTCKVSRVVVPLHRKLRRRRLKWCNGT